MESRSIMAKYTMGNQMISILAWTAAICVLISYSLIEKYGTKQFDWVNALSFIPVIIPIIQAGVYSGAVIPTAFGLIATIKILRRRYGSI